MKTIIPKIRRYYLIPIVFISLSATLGSLFFSELEGLAPCLLCWYQRILMYPIVIIAIIAQFTKDYAASKYILALSIPGFFLAMYHYIIQKSNVLQDSGFCSPDNPCSVVDFEVLGFITIPLLSALAFLAIAIFAGIAQFKTKK